ncbi:triose-phosphate isomerase [Candidatus Woesearchaeota archaeon]|nr:triose-phosphate isomerase [Candidatus Woesearchaeota archaeon]
MKKMIVGNWKMNKTTAEAMVFVKRLKKVKSKADIVMCPAFTALYAVSKLLGKSKIKLGAQNMFYEEKGPYTGEVSPKMLGVDYVILGHSERREYFNETNEEINKKVKAALKNKIKPILCVGESLKQRKAKKAKQVVGNQLKKCLKEVKKNEFSRIIIAYEPIWAIGTGKTATAEQAQEMHSFIRSVVSKIIGVKSSKKLKILYGGSVNPKNIKSIFEMKDIDGALIGGASLKLTSFARMIHLCS